MRNSVPGAAGVLLLLAAGAGCGPHHAVGGGLGVMRVAAGGESETSFSPTLAARVGIPSIGGGFFWALDLQPLPAGNPARDESVSSLFLLPSFQLPAGLVRLRGGVGPSFHIWTGDDPAESSSFGVAWGGSVEVGLGRESPWAVEAFGRFTSGIEVSGQLFGVQLLRYVR